MSQSHLLLSLSLENVLSYGRARRAIDLRPLNVLIGPNASGKSNLLEVLATISEASDDLLSAIRNAGGAQEYINKSHPLRPATIDVSVNNYDPAGTALRYRISVANVDGRAAIKSERISFVKENASEDELYRFEGFTPAVRMNMGGQDVMVTMADGFDPTKSVLAQLRSPVHYPEITYLSDVLGGISLFQEWSLGRRSPARLPQPTDLPNDFLQADASNLGLVLHDLGQTSAKRDELIEHLRRFYDRARFISTKIQGGTLQLYIEEEGGRLIPATRLSDGTLRYLCLLAILLHPNPPPVIGIEEPELGLHPDILPTIAELLRNASERTQLFVTTHSDTLVSALSDTPECILVCESTPDGTTMKRLEAEPLREWLEKYSLGEIWRMGEIGGNRW
jgi:predicted ATPase